MHIRGDCEHCKLTQNQKGTTYICPHRCEHYGVCDCSLEEEKEKPLTKTKNESRWRKVLRQLVCDHRKQQKVSVMTIEDLINKKCEKYEIYKCIICGYETRKRVMLRNEKAK